MGLFSSNKKSGTNTKSASGNAANTKSKQMKKSPLTDVPKTVQGIPYPAEAVRLSIRKRCRHAEKLAAQQFWFRTGSCNHCYIHSRRGNQPSRYDSQN